MSGLEPLAALGLACNIFQAISFGHEVIEVAKKIYRDGTLDSGVAERADHLRDITSRLESTYTLKTTTKSPQEKQLLAIAAKCHNVARDLREEIDFLALSAGKGLLIATIKTAAKVNWRKRRLARLEDQLSNAENLMQTGLLAQVCDRTLAIQRNIDILDEHLRSFLERYQQGHRTAETLIATQHSETRAHMTAESIKTRDSLRHHVTQELAGSRTSLTRDIVARMSKMNLEAAHDTNRMRLLSSLKYSGMNERRNQVTGSYSQTFDWIFEPPGTVDPLANWRPKRDADTKYDRFTSDVSWDSFGEWLKSEETVYWISGKPGSGKTTLVNHILSHASTQSSLDIWKGDTFIVSHFFWRPGTYIQQSIRGMLLSLLYQIVESQPTALDAVLSSVPGILSKDSETDWSRAQLQSALELVLKVWNKPICIFLDGIDEIAPSDSRDFHLISLIGDWISLRPGRMKVCFSSRPEPPIRKRLQVFPHLRLEDLTTGDLATYADGHLGKPFDSFNETYLGTRSRAILSLVEKAEGVFLWLVLAIRSVNEGLENGDDSSDIQVRIDSLDGNIASLYHDMWTRINGASALYRKTTALFLKLVIASRHVACLKGSTPTVFEMLLASTTTADEILSGNGPSVQPGALEAACESTERKILLRSAGILQLSTNKLDDKLLYGWDDKYNPLVKYVIGEQTFTFIHRTAYDFLVDTSEGREILGHDSSSLLDLRFRLIKANIVTCQLFEAFGMPGAGRSRMRPFNVCGRVIQTDEGNYTGPFLSAIRSLRSERPNWQWSTDVDLESDVGDTQQKLLTICKQLTRMGKLDPEYAYGVARILHVEDWEHICGMAVHGLTGLIWSAIDIDSVSPQVLSQVMLSAAAGGGDRYTPATGLIGELLERGSDPNFTSSHWQYHMEYGKENPYYVLETPFTAFLTNILHCLHSRFDDDAWWHTAWKMLERLIEKGASMETGMCFTIQLSDESMSKDEPISILEEYIFAGTLMRLNGWRGIWKHCTCYAVATFKAVDIVRMIHRALMKQLHAPVRTEQGPFKLVEALHEGVTARSGRVIAVVQVAKTDLAINNPCREVSLQDSDSLLDMYLRPFPEPCDTRVDSPFHDRFRQVFDRSEACDDGILDLLVKLGYLTQDVYDGDQDIQNPWKRPESDG